MGRFLRRKLVDAGHSDDSVWQVPPRFNFTRDVVEALASDPLRPALTFVDREGIIDRRTFADVASDASRWAGLLRARGLVAGERVLVAVGPTPAWHAILLGALKAGLVAVPCPETLSAAELELRAARTDARLVVVDAERAGRVAGTRPAMGVIVLEDVAAEVKALPIGQQTHETAATDVAFVLFTPGTTGEPKGVAVTHAGTWSARLQAEHWLDARPGDLVWSTGSTGLASSIWTMLLGPWSRGAETVIHDGAFDVDRHLDLLLRLGATVICQSPAEYRQMVDRAAGVSPDLGRVRHAVSTGEPLTAELVLAFREAFGITLCEGYGQTENTVFVANARSGSIRPGALGLPLAGHEVAVIDAGGNELPPDIEGDLALAGKPPSLFAGYWDDPDLTAAAFRGAWYVTGDRARRDPDGYLWFTGRAETPPREPAASVPDIDAPEPDDVAASRARQADARAAEILALEQAAATEAAKAERIRLEEARLRKQERAAAAAQTAEAEAAVRAARRADLERRTAEALAKEEARRERERAEASAAEQARRDKEERREQARREKEERREEDRRRAAAAAAAEEQARRDAELHREEEHREKVRREEEAAAAKRAEQARHDAEQAQRREEQRAAEAAAAREAQEPAARTEAHEQAIREEAAAPAARSGRAARKEEGRRRKEEEKARKEAERKQQEEERAAAAERKRQEDEEQRAAAERGREAERRRREEEQRLREERKAAAEQERREAEKQAQEARAAAEAQRVEEARQRAAAEEARKEAEKQRRAEEKRQQEEEKRQQEEDRKRFGKSRRTSVPEPGDEHLEEERPNAELIARLRAYGLRERDDASDEDEQPKP